MVNAKINHIYYIAIASVQNGILKLNFGFADNNE